MPTWHEYVQKDSRLPEWPYAVDYDKENEVSCDVLIIGGGVAGCHAAISAANQGAKVVVVDRGHAKRSGAGGAGVDHWHGAVTNPCSKVTPLDYTLACYDSTHGFTSGIARYIITKEGWDTLLECEKMGVQIRDVHDEFKGANFRDEKTKLMFAYDYENKHILRVWGYNIKPMLYKEMQRLGIGIFNRINATSLLTVGGKQGGRVIGATGTNTRTGEFYVFKSKATIIATGGVGRLWKFAPELMDQNSMGDLNSSGAGQAIGWNAGAEFVLMEQSGGNLGDVGYAPYSTGSTSNTFHGAPLVDADGKEVPWVDINGNEFSTVDQRFLPAEGQKFMLGIGIGVNTYLNEFRIPLTVMNLPERIIKGEFKLPLYIDFSRLPELERKCIWGMMVGNEGKTRIPVYVTTSQAGFDPDKDMIQAPVMNPEAYWMTNLWSGRGFPLLRSLAGGGYLVDWDLRTSLEGLYAAGGSPIYGSGCHGESHTTGRYAGRKAALYAKTVGAAAVSRKQITGDKEKAYAPVLRNKDGIGWKEFNYAIARIMQDYCGRYKNETTLNLGLRLLKELKENEGAAAHASNPHELGRLQECFSLITAGEMIMRASLARKCSSSYLDFNRLDYPEKDPAAWDKLLPIRLENDAVKVRDLPLDYHLNAPYAPDYEENYQKHR